VFPDRDHFGRIFLALMNFKWVAGHED
jgi:hypothetical protein